MRTMILHPEFQTILHDPRRGIPAGPVSEDVAFGCWATVVAFAYTYLGDSNTMCGNDPAERYAIAAQIGETFLERRFPGMNLAAPFAPDSLLGYLRTSGYRGVKSAGRKAVAAKKYQDAAAQEADIAAKAEDRYPPQVRHTEERELSFTDVQGLLTSIDISDRPDAAALADLWRLEGSQSVRIERDTLRNHPTFSDRDPPLSDSDVETLRALLVRRLKARHSSQLKSALMTAPTPLNSKSE
ncbi:hypothetical protein [Vitreimonas flagellata]|uniref:hypothetical protein n=1 Tax=Vitreimonas flagellata TaxID=2560861 RepID=UPI0010758BCA|nr:hypothetical protein [Vitreimonas flagellata]